MAGTCDEPTPAMILATAHFRFADDLDLDFELPGLLLPDLVRLPSTERPPASIIAAYSCCEEPVMSAARCWNEWPSVAPSLAVKKMLPPSATVGFEAPLRMASVCTGVRV